MIAACTPDFFERVRGFGSGERTPGVRRGAAAVRHDAHRADPGQPLPGLRRGGDPPCPRHLGRARRTTWRLHRGPSPLGPRDGPPSRFAALGETSRIHPAALRIVDKMPENYVYLGLLAALFPRAKFIHCRRDLRDVAVSCWMTPFREVRWANDQQHIASRFHDLPADDGALAEGLAGAAVGSGLRGDRGRSGRRGPTPRGLVRPGMGASCLEFHQAKRPVSTASAVQVRQPVYQDIGGEDGSTTSRPWLRSSPGWKRCHGNHFRSLGDCDPAPSRRPAPSCRADLSADSRRRAESCRCDPSSRRDCFPSGQARDCRRISSSGRSACKGMRLSSITAWGKRIAPCGGSPKRSPAIAGRWS